jgi:hypothetical protein
MSTTSVGFSLRKPMSRSVRPQATTGEIAQWGTEEDFQKFVLPLALEFTLRVSKEAERRAQLYYSEADPEKLGADGQH